MKFGKLPATEDGQDLKFVDYLDTVALPTTFPHPNFGNGTLFKDWGMLGNDEYGDCVVASRAHLVMLDTKVGAPATARFTAESVIEEYQFLTGGEDTGLNMRDVCVYQRKTGLKDADGKRHKTGAFLSLDPGNPLEAIQAVWIFGGFGFGFSVPESAMEQFDRGEIWDDVGDTNILGGHEVCGVGTMDYTKRLTCVTWGARQEMTFEFLKAYNDESWCWVAPEILNAGGTWRGLNITQLNADLAAI